MIRPEGNPLVTAAGFYIWLKSVLSTGDVVITRAARAGVLVTTVWGHWGHNCHPARSTVEAASGETARTLNRLLTVLVEAGYLHGKRRFNDSTVYCVALIADGRPRFAGRAGPCPLCFPQTALARTRTPSVPSIGTELSPYQEPSSGSAAAGTPAEPANDPRVDHLVLLLIQHRVVEPSDDELVQFMKAASIWVDRRPLPELEQATDAVARKMTSVLTTARVERFFEQQRSVRVPRREALATAAAEQEARRQAAEVILQPLFEWELARDDDQTPQWLRLASSPWARASPLEALDEWTQAGRGLGLGRPEDVPR